VRAGHRRRRGSRGWHGRGRGSGRRRRRGALRVCRHAPGRRENPSRRRDALHPDRGRRASGRRQSEARPSLDLPRRSPRAGRPPRRRPGPRTGARRERVPSLALATHVPAVVRWASRRMPMPSTKRHPPEAEKRIALRKVSRRSISSARSVGGSVSSRARRPADALRRGVEVDGPLSDDRVGRRRIAGVREERHEQSARSAAHRGSRAIHVRTTSLQESRATYGGLRRAGASVRALPDGRRRTEPTPRGRSPSRRPPGTARAAPAPPPPGIPEADLRAPRWRPGPLPAT
jgi:hypothetical protein